MATGVAGVASLSGAYATRPLTALTNGTVSHTSTPTPSVLSDSGFESHSVGKGGSTSFQYDPTGSSWVFTGSAGISGNASRITSANPAAPEGTQVGFLQKTGAITQTVTGLAAGSYQVSFMAAQRGGNSSRVGQNLQVVVDGKMVGTITPKGTAYARYTAGPFTLAAGTHTVSIRGLNAAGGDNTALVDAVKIAPTPTLPVSQRPPNRAPVSRGDAVAAVSGTALAVAAPGVLANDSDPDGDRLTAALVSAPAHGALALRPDGSYTYTPAVGFVGTDAFSYKAIDPAGAASATATVSVTVAAPPRQALETAARAEAAAYITAQAAQDVADMADGMMMMDAQAVLDLVPFESATSVAILNGSWNDPNTWLGQAVPGPGATVWIMPGRTVTVDSASTTPVATVRVSGTLRFDTDHNTLLAADTVVVDPAGTLLMGTADRPVQPSVVAQMTFTGNGPINTTWDPLSISRGLISLGKAEIYGSYVTSHLTLARQPLAGDTSLQLSAAPVGWRPGDTLVLAGTHFTGTSQTQDERLQVASIQGNTVYLTSPVRYNHDVPIAQSLAAQFGQAPPGAPLTSDVGDLTRNVRFVSQNPDVLADRGHVMFMHTQQEAVVNAGFYGLGRTDKSVPIGPTNPRGRYALHFHMDGTDGVPIVASGLAVDGSPGWGVVNHSSNVDVSDSVVYGAVGAAFVSEASDERGSFTNCLALDSTGFTGDNPSNMRGRVAIQDWGYSGHGFWMQSPTVSLTNDVAAGCRSVGIVYYPTDIGANPADLSGITLATDSGNTVYASLYGLYVYQSKPQVPNKIVGLTAWGLQYNPFGLAYSGGIELDGCRFIGSVGSAVVLDNGYRISFHDCYIVGYDVGLEAGYGGRNEITGGYLNNTTDVLIVKNINSYDASLGVRDVAITGVTMAGGGVVMDGTPFLVVADPPFWIRYSPERIVWDGKQLYYAQQAAGFVLPDTPLAALVGKTNAQTLAEFGLAYAGAVTPLGATTLAGLRGGVTGTAGAVAPGPLTPGPAYVKPDGSITQVMFDPIGRVYLFKDMTAGDVTLGWNMITVVDQNGVRRVGFRFV